MKKITLIIVLLSTWILKAQRVDYEILLSENESETSYLVVNESLINFYVSETKEFKCDTTKTAVRVRVRLNLYEFWVKVKHKKPKEIKGIAYSNTYDMKRYLMSMPNKQAQLLAHVIYDKDGNVLWSSYFDSKEYMNPIDNDITLTNIHPKLRGSLLGCVYLEDPPIINKQTTTK